MKLRMLVILFNQLSIWYHDNSTGGFGEQSLCLFFVTATAQNGKQCLRVSWQHNASRGPKIWRLVKRHPYFFDVSTSFDHDWYQREKFNEHRSVSLFWRSAHKMADDQSSESLLQFLKVINSTKSIILIIFKKPNLYLQLCRDRVEWIERIDKQNMLWTRWVTPLLSAI